MKGLSIFHHFFELFEFFVKINLELDTSKSTKMFILLNILIAINAIVLDNLDFLSKIGPRSF